jgi:hypothetical protein
MGIGQLSKQASRQAGKQARKQASPRHDDERKWHQGNSQFGINT